MHLPPFILKHRRTHTVLSPEKGHALDQLDAVEKGGNRCIDLLHRHERRDVGSRELGVIGCKRFLERSHATHHVAVAVEEHLRVTVDFRRAAIKRRTLLVVHHHVRLASLEVGHRGQKPCVSLRQIRRELLSRQPLFPFEQVDSRNHADHPF